MQRWHAAAVHGEVTSAADIDIFDREVSSVDKVMQPALKDLPGLRVVFEHITTEDAAQFRAPDTIAATSPRNTCFIKTATPCQPAHPAHISTACRF